MKKLLAMLLCAAMILSLTACGDGYKTDKNAKAEDIFSAAVTNLSNTVKTMLDKDAEPAPFSFKMTGSVSAALKMPAEAAAAAGNTDLSITASGEANGLVDNKKGASVTLKAETNAMKVLGSLFGPLMPAGKEAEDMKIEAGAYVDLESGRTYVQDPDTKSWSWTSFDPNDLKNVDLKEVESATLDKVFETYTFTVEKEAYIFEGTAKAEAVNTDALDNEMVSEISGMIKDLKPALKLTVDPDKRITGAVMTVKDYTLDLGEMLGLSAVISDLSLDLGITYGPVSYQLPDDVKNAPEKED
ncbi:MAG: hypothetical protein IJK86_03680 [Lachnospiraceae bacterium]|nr:hypothetical protein [Lachnospiraceae bacterium]